METEEVHKITGIATSTIRKYALLLDVEYTGTGRRKIYNWKKSDIEKLKKSIGKRGRPKAEND